MTERSQVSILTVMLAVLLVSGCATQKQPIYNWGGYEERIYEIYAKPGEAEPSAQVAKLSADVERTLAEGKRVPPGVHAHLGYMYYMQGNKGAAMNEFATEKDLFPESAIFIDGILERLQRD